MAVSGRQNWIRYLARQPTIKASDAAMFSSANIRACSTKLFCVSSGIARSMEAQMLVEIST